MDFVKSYFGTNEPLTSWTLFSSLFDWFAVCAKQTNQKVRKKVFNWSKVHLYWIQCLKNGSGKSGPGMLIPFSPSLSNSINSVVCKVPLKVVPPVIKVFLIKSCSGSLSKIETSWTVYSSWISKIWISGNNSFLV